MKGVACSKAFESLRPGARSFRRRLCNTMASAKRAVIAIDGGAASGKGTLSKTIATTFNLAHLDTGLLYRAVGFKALKSSIAFDDVGPLVRLSNSLSPDDLKDPDLRGDEAAKAASQVSVIPGVRMALGEFPRQFASNPPQGFQGAVLDGRDVGTVLCPDAEVKLFLIASAEVRARRRLGELVSRGMVKDGDREAQEETYQQVLADLKERDLRDSSRSTAPLKPAGDAHVIDTSEMSAREVLDKAVCIIQGACPWLVRDLVLVGGGHTHVEVLRSFGMHPLPGVRVTLVTRDMHTPYSGMLPGFISGFYSYDDCHIDLSRLCSFAKARLIHHEAAGLDIKGRRVVLQGRPPLSYDVLSINVGITPSALLVPGAQEHATAVKPIDRFVAKFEALLERYRRQKDVLDRPMRITVVGGGAGGVEVALSLQFRLEEERRALGLPESCRAQILLVCRGGLMDGHVATTRSALRRISSQRGLVLIENDPVVAVRRGTDGSSSLSLSLASGREVPSQDEVLWCTQAGASGWLRATGLPTDSDGFLAVDACLRSDGGPPEVFAAGDCASCTPYPRPKAGVYAVRQGPPLVNNLRAFLTGRPLEPFVPQSTNLSLIGTGDRYCVATKGWLALEGAWLWNVKDSIDRSFMRKYGDMLDEMKAKMMAAGAGGAGAGASSGIMSGALSSSWWRFPSWHTGLQRTASQPPLTGYNGQAYGTNRLEEEDGGHGWRNSGAPEVYSDAGLEALMVFAESKMRCGGCGSKVGASVLSRVLSRLKQLHQDDVTAMPTHDVVIGLDRPDDAALVRPPPPGHLLVQTVDFFRSFWDDPFIFGKITANHALGDCYAMGGRPRTALAIASVPFGTSGKMEEELFQMMAGASEVLREAGCILAGGHTCEGEETSLGFTINGEVEEGRALHKSGLQPGDILLLTKPLGTGTLMAAAMKGKAKGRWIEGAIDTMQQSSQRAASVLMAHGCSSCTDVTGFGLLGHMVEMAQASQVHLDLKFEAVPVLPGALECLKSGALSSLHRQNAVAASLVSGFDDDGDGGPGESISRDPRWPILVDPQTAGGLLAGVPEGKAEACLSQLRSEGYREAAIIGHVSRRDGAAQQCISLVQLLPPIQS